MIDYKNNSDKRSRDMVRDLLISKGVTGTDITDSDGNCVWDLMVNYNGKKYSFEIKDRNCFSYTYGDIMVENAKRIYTKQNYSFDKSFAVNVYTDGIVAMANLYDDDGKVITLKCPMETWSGGDHTIITKECVIIPQRLKFTKLNNKWARIK